MAPGVAAHPAEETTFPIESEADGKRSLILSLPGVAAEFMSSSRTAMRTCATT
jgi:hypothetical protein